MPGRKREQRLGQFAASDTGHDDVGDEDIDVFFAGLGDAQTGLAIFGFEDFVAARGEGETHEFAHGFLVFDQQDGFAAAGFVVRDLAGLISSADLPPAANRRRKLCPLPELALGEYVSIALLDDAVNGGEAEAGAFPFSLVVKNGSKMRDWVSLSMPWPVSETEITA
jgi:hypothetical protein